MRPTDKPAVRRKVKIKMPEEIKGKPESKIWQSILSTREVQPDRVEQLAAYCRARVDEVRCREELQNALDNNDPDGASKYGRLVHQMRDQLKKLYEEI